MSLDGMVNYVLSYGPNAGQSRPFLITGKRRETRTRMVGIQRPDGQTAYQPQAVEEDVYDGYLFANASDDPAGGPAHHAGGPVHLFGLSEGSAQQVGTDFLLPAGTESQAAQQAAGAGGAPSLTAVAAATPVYSQPSGGAQSQQGADWLANSSRAQRQAQEAQRAQSTWYASGAAPAAGV